MILGLSLYLLANVYQYVSKDNIIKRTKKCRYCRKKVNEKVGFRALVKVP
jgi:large conductance mechanosensitive channel